MGWLREPKKILAARETERVAQEEAKRLVHEETKREETERIAKLMAVWEKLQIDRIIEDVRNTIWPKGKISEITKHGRGFQKSIFQGETCDYTTVVFSVCLYADSIILNAGGNPYTDSYFLAEIVNPQALQVKVEKLLVDKLQKTRKPTVLVGGEKDVGW